MKLLFLPLLFLIGNAALVQAQDTLYLNSDNKPISKKKNAHHTKITTKTDTGYVVELLNKEQVLYSKTTYKDPELKITHGYSVGYLGKTKGSEGSYVNGKQEGTWKYYHWDGNVSGVVNYKNGQKSGEEYFKPDGQKETDLTKTERLPSFPGGNKALGDFLIRTLKYPQPAKDRKVSGQVKVGFTVSTTGELQDIRVISGPDDDLNKEALRVVRWMPQWTPGVQYNRPVKVAYVLPVNFRLTL